MDRPFNLHVRLTEEEKNQIDRLIAAYGLDNGASELVRLTLQFIDDKRPALTKRIMPLKKGLAPKEKRPKLLA
jgi:Arc/MetJ-type ribon-helix-helix transcriptional regulator